MSAPKPEYLTFNPSKNSYDALVLAVKHDEFIELGAEKLKEYGAKNHVFFDLKNAFDSSYTDGSL